jgi:hypothetical protein
LFGSYHESSRLTLNGCCGTAGEDYASVKAEIAELRQYKTSARREWVVEQANLATLLGNIQAKLQSLKRPLYVPPAGLSVRDVELNFEALSGAERTRRSALNQKLRAILGTELSS